MTIAEQSVDEDIEISLLSDSLEPDSLEAEEINEIMEEIFKEQKIQEEVEAGIKELISNVEKAVVVSLEKKPLFRKCPINKVYWKVNK